MAGEEGEVISAEGDLYRVFIRGEYWYAKSAQSLAINSRVRVVKLQPGMRLTVEPVSSEPAKEEPQTEGEK
jgi:membrane protein implicated in regulation of membrane protease activity